MKNRKVYLTIGIFIVTALSIISLDTSSGLIHSGGINILKNILRSTLRPEISPEILAVGIEAMFTTMVYAFAGMSLAIAIGFVLGIISSGLLFTGKPKGLIPKLTRGLLGFMRAIHELVWAWLFVASIGLTPLAGVFALAIPYGGILGRIYSDMLNDVPNSIIENLKSSGASRLQRLFYGYLPLASAKMISYTMYRFECAIRSSTIMSFVGLGGIGFQIQMALYDFDFNKTWTFVYILIAVVILMDVWSNAIRRKLI